ncbi:winged helix-turn-helix transcriptional regulator, partial [Clostridioides difficile]
MGTKIVLSIVLIVVVAVLEQIIKNGPISRASIASTIGLNKATISAITKKLIDESLVHE